MARPVGGSFGIRLLADDTRAFRLRFLAGGQREIVVLHERVGCQCGCGGGWDERAARTELGNILARVRAGVWQPADPPVPAAGGASAARGVVPSFHEYSSLWLQAKIDGVLGDKPIDANTQADYRWRLSRHLLPFFAGYGLDAIDRQLCLAFKSHKLREASELREAVAAGADLRDQRGRRLQPLSASSIRKLIDVLAAILDDAIEDEHIDRNPARSKRMRVRVPKPARSFLEMDELAALIDAAADQDGPLRPARPAPSAGVTQAQVARLVNAGRRPAQIAAELGLARSTVTFHLKRLDANVASAYVGRRAVVEILGRSGVRASELCDLRVGHVRLHDPDGARFRIPDSKTEAGIREVQMTPDLVEIVIEHLDRLRRLGAPTGPDAYLVPNLRGGRMDRQRVGQIVADAADAASTTLTRRGLPPLPRTTPHSLRRTYISIALLANNFDVKWVMGQVGHADSKMTMDVYAQLEQRAQRSHGTSFDRLVRTAREQLHGSLLAPSEAGVLVPKRYRPPETPLQKPVDHPAEPVKNQPDSREEDDMARPGLEPGTPRFSAVAAGIYTFKDAGGNTAAIWLGIDWFAWAALWFLFSCSWRSSARSPASRGCSPSRRGRHIVGVRVPAAAGDGQVLSMSRTDFEIFGLEDFTLEEGATLRSAGLAYTTYLRDPERLRGQRDRLPGVVLRPPLGERVADRRRDGAGPRPLVHHRAEHARQRLVLVAEQHTAAVRPRSLPERDGPRQRAGAAQADHRAFRHRAARGRDGLVHGRRSDLPVGPQPP